MSQDSTRTVTAAVQALQALWIQVQKLDSSKSSKGKWEWLASETSAFTAHNIDVILSRDKGFEKTANKLKQWNNLDNNPARVSLWWNEFHPTQTLWEILIFMDEYWCSSVQELSEITKKKPPLIIFMWHTKFKRADKALIQFIIKHFPHWKIKNLIPDNKYNPEIEWDNFDIIVNNNLTDTDNVSKLTKWADFLYISNAEGTSLEWGKWDGKKSTDYRLNLWTVKINNLKVLHPLPAWEDSEWVKCEFDKQIFDTHGQYMSQQMKNKVAIISSLVAHQLTAKEERKKNSHEI